MRVWLKKRKRKHGEYWALRWRAGGHMHYESLGRASGGAPGDEYRTGPP